MEPNNEPNTNPNTEPTERTFTQAQLDAIVAREKAKATKGLFTAEDMSAKDDSINAITQERDTARADLKKAQDELNGIKQRQVLAKYGVAEEDVDYYAFKIGQKVTDKVTFEKAAEEFFKENKPAGARFYSTGGNVGGGNPGKANTNDTMNELIRRARK